MGGRRISADNTHLSVLGRRSSHIPSRFFPTELLLTPNTPLRRLWLGLTPFSVLKYGMYYYGWLMEYDVVSWEACGRKAGYAWYGEGADTFAGLKWDLCICWFFLLGKTGNSI
jgi:hypothetical protein